MHSKLNFCTDFTIENKLVSSVQFFEERFNISYIIAYIYFDKNIMCLSVQGL